MKRLFLVVAAALAAAVLVTGTGTAGDVRGKKCTDISFGDGAYVTRTVPGDASSPPLANPYLEWTVSFDQPNCSELTSLYVYDNSDTESSPLVTLTSTQTGVTSITFTYTFNSPYGVAAPADENICIVGTTSWSEHVADRAPNADAGCLALSGIEGSPATGFN
jgi:hypothetical protein